MENYIEQSVSGKRSMGKTVLYALCWCATALMLVLAMFFGTAVFGDNPDVLEINWLNVVLLLLCLLAAFGFFRRKDYVYMEYDYILRGETLEISGILNARRRRRLAEIPLERIRQIGSLEGADGKSVIQNPQYKKHRWLADPDARIHYLVYMEKNTRHLALLELNDEMLAAIRKSGKLSWEAWRCGEGMTSNYASLS